MKKAFLVVFLLLDLAVMAGAGYVLYTHLTKGQSAGNIASAPPRLPIAPVVQSSSAVPSLVSPLPSPSNTTAPTGTDAEMRKILFSYHNSKARQVSIRAEFTGWKAEPMVRDARGVWTYQSSLLPGEYAYCFTVDDKTFKDPANPRTKQIGRTFVSAIVVEAKGGAK